MIDGEDYKNNTSNNANIGSLVDLVNDNGDDATEANIHFHSCFSNLYKLDKDGLFSEEFSCYKEILDLLSSNSNLNFSLIRELSIFNIFLNFIQNLPEHYQEVSNIIVKILISFYKRCGRGFVNDFSSSQLCIFFIMNLNESIFDMFSIFVGESKQLNEIMTNHDFFSRIPNITSVEFLRAKYLTYANYFLTCNADDFSACLPLVDECVNLILKEEDDECFKNRIVCIERAVDMSPDILKILVSKEIFVFVNEALQCDNPSRLDIILRLLTVLTADTSDFVEKLGEDLSLPLLMLQITKPEPVCQDAMNCLLNISACDAFSLDDYAKSNFSQIMNFVFNNGSFKMKMYALNCVYNLLKVLGCLVSDLWSDDTIDEAVSAILAISPAKTEEVWYCICFIQSLLDEDKIGSLEDVGNFIFDIRQKSNLKEISAKCDLILSVINSKLKE